MSGSRSPGTAAATHPRRLPGPARIRWSGRIPRPLRLLPPSGLRQPPSSAPPVSSARRRRSSRSPPPPLPAAIRWPARPARCCWPGPGRPKATQRRRRAPSPRAGGSPPAPPRSWRSPTANRPIPRRPPAHRAPQRNHVPSAPRCAAPAGMRGSGPPRSPLLPPPRAPSGFAAATVPNRGTGLARSRRRPPFGSPVASRHRVRSPSGNRPTAATAAGGIGRPRSRPLRLPLRRLLLPLRHATPAGSTAGRNQRSVYFFAVPRALRTGYLRAAFFSLRRVAA